MKLLEVIDYLDSVKPNAYSTKEKIIWINNVEGMIKTEVMRDYTAVTINIADKENLQYDLGNINIEDISEVYFDKKRVSKVDFRDAVPMILNQDNNTEFNYDTITLILLNKHVPYRYVNYASGQNSIVFTDSTITLPNADYLLAGDFIEIKGCTNAPSNNKIIEIKEKQDNVLSFGTGAFTPTTETDVEISRYLNDVLILEPPYSEMYYFYLSSKIDYLNKEYESYNNTISQFNSLFNDYKNWYAQQKGSKTAVFNNFY